jgi:seryl-tRNA synthetase
MNRLIELEDKYLSREISSREYLKERGKLVRKLNEVIRENNVIKKRLMKEVGDIEKVKETIDLVNEIEDMWRELRRLEENFLKKKIETKQYIERRKQIILEFKTLIKRVETIT